MVKGFIKLPQNIITPDLNGAALKVLAFIKLRAELGEDKLSLRYISASLGSSTNTVRKAIAYLSSHGWITAKKRRGPGGRQSTVYTVLLATEDKGYIKFPLPALALCSASEAYVLAALLSYRRGNGNVYPSERALSRKTGLTRETVRRASASLEALGFLRKYTRYYRKRGFTCARRSFEYIFAAADMTPGEEEPRKDTDAIPCPHSYGYTKAKKRIYTCLCKLCMKYRKRGVCRVPKPPWSMWRGGLIFDTHITDTQKKEKRAETKPINLPSDLHIRYLKGCMCAIGIHFHAFLSVRSKATKSAIKPCGNGGKPFRGFPRFPHGKRGRSRMGW